MAWRGDSWSDLVARAASASPRQKSILAEDDHAALAARAEPWVLPGAIALSGSSLTLGAALESVEVALAQVYHVEPVDPWPSLALGWVDRGQSCRTVLTPEDDVDAFAATVETILSDARLTKAAARGWLMVETLAWERVEAMPGEHDEGPAMRGYRAMPEAPDPILATRETEPGAPSLWTWIWSRLVPAPRRIDPREIVLTRAFVYARTRNREALRIPASTLRTARRTLDGDTILVFGRNTELLLVKQDGCPLAAELESRVSGELERSRVTT